jgi:hypothetical protein
VICFESPDQSSGVMWELSEQYVEVIVREVVQSRVRESKIRFSRMKPFAFSFPLWNGEVDVNRTLMVTVLRRERRRRL